MTVLLRVLFITYFICVILFNQCLFARQNFDLTGLSKADECDVIKGRGCKPDHCCVYQVLINRINRSTTKIRQRCQPLKTEGEFCLTKPEHFMCTCQEGLICRTEDNDNFGHCESNN